MAKRSPVPRAAAGRVLLRGSRLEAAAAPERAGRQLSGGIVTIVPCAREAAKSAIKLEM